MYFQKSWRIYSSRSRKKFEWTTSWDLHICRQGGSANCNICCDLALRFHVRFKFSYVVIVKKENVLIYEINNQWRKKKTDCYFFYCIMQISIKKTTYWTFQNECTLYVPFFITLIKLLIIQLLWSIKWGIFSRYNLK